jgi:predicted ester cyclase
MRPTILMAALIMAMPFLCLGQATDEEKRNEAVVRHFMDAGPGNPRLAISDLAEDVKNFGRPGGRELFRAILEDIHTTFPDWHVEIEEMVAKGDSVIVRCKVSGTHLGIGKLPVNGGLLVGVQPTKKHFEVEHIHWLKLRDGKIVDHFATRDDIGMMRQLGLLPPSPPFPTPAGAGPSPPRQNRAGLIHFLGVLLLPGRPRPPRCRLP